VNHWTTADARYDILFRSPITLLISSDRAYMLLEKDRLEEQIRNFRLNLDEGVEQVRKEYSFCLAHEKISQIFSLDLYQIQIF
jgi:thermostable 8-oxoguanine DNA glycosylase